MSKYIIEIDDDLTFDVQFLQAIGAEPNGVVRIRHIEFEELEELNSDYINEHYGQLQDEAYKRGFEDGKAHDDKGCSGCAYIGQTAFSEPCVRCSNCYKNRYQPKKKDDEIKVGDEVRWGMDLIVITRLYMDGGLKWCDGISKDGIAFHVLEENVSKTNRHFDIDKILREMNE